MAYTKQNFADGNALMAAQLNAMDDQIADNDTRIANVSASVSSDEKRIDATDRRVDALFKVGEGVVYDFESDDDEGNKTIPTGAKAVSVLSVGGTSRNGYNLFDTTKYFNIFSSGNYFRTNTNYTTEGVIDVVGGTTYTFTFTKTTEGKDANIREFDSNNTLIATTTLGGTTADRFSKTVTMDTDTKKISIYAKITDDGSCSVDIAKPQLEEGSIAHDYEQYTDEILHADVTTVEVAGVNLIGDKWKDDEGNVILYPVDIRSNDSVYMSMEFIPSDRTPMVNFYYADGTSYDYWNVSAVRPSCRCVTFGNATKPIRYISYRGDYTGTKIMVTKSSDTAKTYTPYIHTTLTIPTAIRNLTGYGWSAGSVYNEVDFERKKYVQKVGRIDLGTLDYTLAGSNPRFICTNVPNLKANEATGEKSNLICSKYTSDTANNTGSGYVDNAMCSKSETSGARLWIRNTAYNSVSEFKSAMNGVYLYYELATPVETDISAYLTDDSCIACEAGGSIDFVNANNLSVPNTVEYIVKLSEVN